MRMSDENEDSFDEDDNLRDSQNLQLSSPLSENNKKQKNKKKSKLTEIIEEQINETNLQSTLIENEKIFDFLSLKDDFQVNNKITLN